MTMKHTALVLLAIFPAISPAQQPSHVSPDTTDRAAAAANMEMAHMGDMSAHMLHMYMTPQRPATLADSVRARELVAEMRRDLARFRDVRVAEAEGFRQFLPNVPQPVYHFTNWRWAIEEAFRFDPAKPTSLLYRKNADGSFTLVGAMYTEPRRASESDLDRRIPLGIAQWHQHVNWCIPKRGEQARWGEMKDGKPVFGPESPVATETACDAVGGRFVPHLFGWMVHANVFASDDPAVIWGHGAGKD
jgi:hypothetical protein